HYPYGEQWYASNTTTKFFFTSYGRDSETGNDYAMARFYINRFGRFSCADPVLGSPADPQSWNRYAYVRNNPVNAIDPSGLSFITWFLKALLNIISGLPSLSGLGPLGQTPPTFPTVDNITLSNIYFIHKDFSRTMISENWSPAAHDQMLWDALAPCGVSPAFIALIQKSSRDFDSAHQDPNESYMHSMSDGTAGQGPAAAI